MNPIFDDQSFSKKHTQFSSASAEQNVDLRLCFLIGRIYLVVLDPCLSGKSYLVMVLTSIFTLRELQLSTPWSAAARPGRNIAVQKDIASTSTKLVCSVVCTSVARMKLTTRDGTDCEGEVSVDLKLRDGHTCASCRCLEATPLARGLLLALRSCVNA